MSRQRVSLFSFGIAIIFALAASMGVAQAVTCTPVGSTVTCTGGAGASISLSNSDNNTHAGTPFPTTINVTGGGGSLQSMTVTIHGYSSDVSNGEGSRDVGLLLVSPSGRNMELLRCVGDGAVGQSNITFTLQDGATRVPSCRAADSNFGSWTTGGTYSPSANISPAGAVNYAQAGAPAAAHTPANVGTATLNSVNGVFTGDTVNGNWSLYLVDNTPDFATVSFSSWDIALTFNNATTPSTTTLTPNPTTAYTSAANSSVVLTANVTANATGTVTFREGNTVLTCTQGAQPRTLTVGNPSSAVCTTTFAAEGYHALTASYSGDSTFVASTGNSAVYTQNHSGNVGTVYCNTGAILGDGQSNVSFTHVNPYPSVIFVGDGTNTDLPNSVNTLSVQLKNFAAVSNITDMHMLLVAPDGTHAFDFWGNAGSTLGGGNYTLIDGSAQLPNSGGIGAGSYGATTYFNTDLFTPAPPSPAPQLPGSFVLAPPAGSDTFQTAFVGAAAHGAWKLFLYNGSGGGVTTDLNGGWCLNISPATGHPTTVVVGASPTQAVKGTPITFTATVTSTQTVNTGTVTFTENGAPLTGAPNGGAANVNGSGVAMISTIGLPEGDHIVKALYHDASNTFSDNFGSVTVRVDAGTATPTLNGSTWSYCNPSGIVIPRGVNFVDDIGAAAPNPSNIFVTNLPGTINAVGVTLKSFHVTSPGDLDSLLVGPNGGSNPTTAQTLDFFSGAGGNGGSTAFNHDTSFLDGFSAVSCTAGGPAPGTNNAPTSCAGASTSYTVSPFYILPGAFQDATPDGAFTFNTGTYTPGVGGGVYKNTLPNGTWSLYFNQNIHHSGDGASSWCANFTENPVTVTATKGHTGRPPNGHFQQGEQTGASFSFNITNNGDANGKGSTGDPDGMHGLKVIDVLDASAFTPGTLPTGSPWNCAAVTNTVTCTSSLSIAPTMSYPVLTIPVIVKDNAPASATNQGSLSGGGITATMSTMDTVTIDPAPILAISKAHIGTFTQGQTAQWTLQVANNSATAAGNTNGTTVTVIDTLPTGYTLSSFTGTNWMCAGNMNVVTCTSNDAINGNGGMFPLITLTVNVPADSPTSVSNSAKVFGGGDVIHTNAGSAAMSNTDTVTVIQVPAFVNINGSATQSTLINTAFGSLAVTVQDAGHVPIPNYMSVVFTAPASGASGTFGNNSNTTSVTTGSGGSAGVADPGTFTANGIPGPYMLDVLAGTIHATFNLTNTEPDLTIVKTNTVSGNANLGGSWTWKLHVANAGTGPAIFAATKTLVTDNLPNSNINYGTPSNATNIVGTITNSGAISCGISSNDLSCTANAQTVTMAAGSSFDVTFTATPTAMGTFANPRQAGVCQVDPGNVVPETNENNNSCSDSVTVTAPDLTAVKSDNVTGATTLGNPWTWKIHVANGGNGPAVFQATQAMLTDDLATTGLNYGTPMVTSTGVTNGGTISCAINGSPSLTCSAQAQVVTITPGGFFEVTFSVTPTAIGTYANPRNGGTCKADPASLVPESDETNNTCSGSVVVTAPDLTVGKTHNPTTFTVNDQGDTFTITVTNSGNAPTTGTVTVTDNLPMGLTFAGSPTMGWSCNANGSNPVICTTTNAISGNGGTSSLVLNVNVAGSTGSPLTNNVSVGCSCTESNTGNNTGSDMVTVLQVVNVTLDAVDANMQHQGLTISLDGGTAFTAPHTYQLTPNSMHTIATTSPQPPSPVGTEYVFNHWSDMGAISHSITVPNGPSTITSFFDTFYQISLDGIPSGGGTVSPATGTFYPKNFVLNISATANPGYQFVNWTGDPVANANSASTTITMDAPHTVHANFSALPTNLGATSTGKSGPLNARQWNFTITNTGPGAASGALITSFTLVQSGGPACSSPPVVGTVSVNGGGPQALPNVPLGNMAANSSVPVTVTIDFSTCTSAARFTQTISLSANGGATTASVPRFNQFP
jgi:uncharacterized repeat protein (TIGR01451 family)